MIVLVYIFVSPLWLSCNMLHRWKDYWMLVKPLAACTHLSQQFPSYSNRKYKNSRFFAYRSPHVCFPWRRPCDYNTICCMDGKTIQCLSNPRSMYPSILNTFWVIRWLSQCVSPKIAIFTTFLFPLGTPLGQSYNMLHGWKDNSMLTNSLAECTYVSTTVSDIERDNCEIDKTWRTVSAIATRINWWLWHKNKTYSSYKHTELYCRGTDWMQQSVD